MAKRRNPGQVRSDLLEAAAKLIARQGLGATNSNEIAREAGVGVGSFYRHFRDKGDLFESLQREMTHAMRDRTRSAAATAKSVEGQVRALVEASVKLAEERPEAFRVLASTAGPRSPVRLSRKPVEKRLAEMRAGGLLDSSMDPVVAAKGFEVMQEGVLAWWLEDPRRAKRASVIETLVRLHPALAGKSTREATEAEQDLASGVE